MLEQLRNAIIEQLQKCEDAELLDLVYKLLLSETS